MDTYNLDSSTEQVTLFVNISSLGLANSRAILINNEQGTPVAHSVNSSGDIPTTAIGAAATLKGQKLSILTRVDFVGGDAQRKSAYDSLTASYVLTVNDANPATFSDPEKYPVDDNYSGAILNEVIQLS